jgi:hypothetical protein
MKEFLILFIGVMLVASISFWGIVLFGGLMEPVSDFERLENFKTECLHDDAYTTKICREAFTVECGRLLGYDRVECVVLWGSEG